MTATVQGIFLSGDHASRPAASAPPVGSVYSCSDHGLVYQTDGSAWATWLTAGGGMTNPMNASGDIIYGGASGTPTRLAKGTDGYVLTLASGLPSWASAGASGHAVYGVELRRTSNQSISNTTTAAISWDTEDRDDATFWAVSPNPTRITFGSAGWAICSAQVRWASNASGKRLTEWRINGSSYYHLDDIPNLSGANDPGQTTSFAHYFSASDYLELTVWQNSGGALNLSSAHIGVMQIR